MSEDLRAAALVLEDELAEAKQESDDMEALLKRSNDRIAELEGRPDPDGLRWLAAERDIVTLQTRIAELEQYAKSVNEAWERSQQIIAEQASRLQVAPQAYNEALEQKHAALKLELVQTRRTATKLGLELQAGKAHAFELDALLAQSSLYRVWAEARIAELEKQVNRLAHIINPAERAVLDAAATEGPLREWGLRVWAAERARREAAKP